MRKILFILISFLLIPLSSYSQDTTLVINKYQIQSILKDKVELDYLRKITYQDALLIQELEAKVIIQGQIGEEYKELVVIKEETIDRLRLQNRLIIIGASVASGYLLYQTLK